MGVGGGASGEDVLREGRDQTLDEIPSSRRNAGADARARIRGDGAARRTRATMAPRDARASRGRPRRVRRRASAMPPARKPRSRPPKQKNASGDARRDATPTRASRRRRRGAVVVSATHHLEKSLCVSCVHAPNKEGRRGTRPPGFVLACEGIARRRAARVRVFRRFVSVHPGTRRRSPREAASSHSRARRRGFPHPSRDSRPRPRAPLRASHRASTRGDRASFRAHRGSRRVASGRAPEVSRSAEASTPDDPGGGSDMSGFQPHGSGVGGGQVRISYIPSPDLTSSRASSSRKRDARPPGGSRRRDRRDEISLVE